MQRYMIHLENKLHTPKNVTILLSKARELVGPDIIVRDVRVSKKYLEFDISIPDNVTVDSITEKLEKISTLAEVEHLVERFTEKSEAIKRAIKLFNDEKYWGAHEALEGVWKNANGIEKNILNGIILVAAAFVHNQKDESEICLSILQRAEKKLNGISGYYYEINIDRISELISKIIRSGIIEHFTI